MINKNALPRLRIPALAALLLAVCLLLGACGRAGDVARLALGEALSQTDVRALTPEERQSALRVTGEPLAGWYIDRLGGQDYDIFQAMYQAAAQSRESVQLDGAPYGAMLRALTALRYDCPELMHFTGDVDYTYDVDSANEEYVYELRFDYLYSAEEYAAKLAQVTALLEQWKARVASMSELDAERFLYQAVMDRCEYAEGPYDSDVYGTLILGEAVCMGYAYALSLALRYCAGMECIYVGGEAYDPYEEKTEPHAWNIVKVNGVYCAVDATWDDMAQEESWLPGYFNLSDAYMLRNRSYDAEYEDFAMPPSCETMRYEAYTTAGRFISSRENPRDGLFAMLNAMKIANRGAVAYRLATLSQFEQTKNSLENWFDDWCQENAPDVTYYSTILDEDCLIVWIGAFES